MQSVAFFLQNHSTLVFLKVERPIFSNILVGRTRFLIVRRTIFIIVGRTMFIIVGKTMFLIVGKTMFLIVFYILFTAVQLYLCQKHS